MRSNYNDCLIRLLKDEGGYTNNPNDNGGPTNYGITLTDYRKYINKTGTASDVRNMDVNDAKKVYKSKYWDALDCDNLPSGVDYSCFDYGVNSGLGRPRKALQRFKSLKGTELIDAINNERVSFLKALEAAQPKDKEFDKGWMRRVAGVRAYSKILASKKDAIGAGTGGVIAGTGISLSQYWHNHQTLIIIGAIVSAIVIGTIVHTYRNRNK